MKVSKLIWMVLLILPPTTGAFLYLSHSSRDVDNAPVAFAAGKPKTQISKKVPSQKASFGVGLNGVSDWSTQFPFIDLMKQSRQWGSWQKDADKSWIIKTDARGWIETLEPRQSVATVFLVSHPNQPMIAERLIVLYDGNGVLEYPWQGRKINALSIPGRDVVEVGEGNHLLRISKTDPDNPIRNIRIIPERFLKHYQRGEIFNPIWLNKLRGFTKLRFMDWMETNDSSQQIWSERPRVEDQTWATKGVPLEVMIRLANELAADPWFNIPHQADLDYIKQFASLVKKQLKPDLKIYMEHSNEVWNWQFAQAHYAKEQGQSTLTKGKAKFMQWHGIRTAQMCDVFKNNVFVKQAERVQCVLGVQTAWRGLHKSALDCPGWDEAPCYKHGIDYLAITGYYAGGVSGPRKARRDEKTAALHAKIVSGWAQSGSDGIDKAFEQLMTGTHLRQVERFKSFNGVGQHSLEKFNYWKQEALERNLGIVVYEGGPHITANGHVLQENSDVQLFHAELNRHKRMGEAYTEVLEAWKKAGGGAFLHFVDVSAPSKWGSWGALEHFQQETSPKWEAITNQLKLP